MGYKAYSDSYLMSLTKAQIIELLRVAEHNFFATEEALNNSAKAGMEIAEKYDKAKEHYDNTLCECWLFDYDNHHHYCNGTKERDMCHCGGDVKKCDFYPKKRGE